MHAFLYFFPDFEYRQLHSPLLSLLNQTAKLYFAVSNTADLIATDLVLLSDFFNLASQGRTYFFARSPKPN